MKTLALTVFLFPAAVMAQGPLPWGDPPPEEYEYNDDGWRNQVGPYWHVKSLKFLGDVIAGQVVTAKADFRAEVHGPEVAESYAFRGTISVGHTVQTPPPIVFWNDVMLASASDQTPLILSPGESAEWSLVCGAGPINPNASHGVAEAFVSYSNVDYTPDPVPQGNWSLPLTGIPKIKKPVSSGN